MSSTKTEIIAAIRDLARNVDLDPQGRYDMLAEVASVLRSESDTLYDENDLDENDEWTIADDEDDEYDDEYDDGYGDDDDDDFDDDFDDEDEFAFDEDSYLDG